MSNPGTIHSTLSFSGRKRWAACPASVYFGAGVEDKSSPTAAEGTAAHTVAEFYVRQAFGLPGAKEGDAPFQPAIRELDRFADLVDGAFVTEEAIWNGELRTAARAYVDFIKSLIPEGCVVGTDVFISVELKVAAKSIDNRLFGTLDLTLWFPKWRHAIIVDYKYGFADVPVKDDDGFNPQLTAYLVALLDQCTLEAEGATLAVFQPRRVAGVPGQVERLTKEQIAHERARLASNVVDVDATLELIATRTASGAKDFADLCNPGEHCRYCRAAKGPCPAVIDGVQTVLDVEAGTRSLLDMLEDDVLALYARRTALKAFFENIEARVELMAKSGHKRIERVETKGRRIWQEGAAAALIALGLEQFLVPGKVSDVAGEVPVEFHDVLFRQSRGSVTLKVLDAPSASATAKIFEKYSK